MTQPTCPTCEELRKRLAEKESAIVILKDTITFLYNEIEYYDIHEAARAQLAIEKALAATEGKEATLDPSTFDPPKEAVAYLHADPHLPESTLKALKEIIEVVQKTYGKPERKETK